MAPLSVQAWWPGPGRAAGLWGVSPPERQEPEDQGRGQGGGEVGECGGRGGGLRRGGVPVVGGFVWLDIFRNIQEKSVKIEYLGDFLKVKLTK